MPISLGLEKPEPPVLAPPTEEAAKTFKSVFGMDVPVVEVPPRRSSLNTTQSAIKVLDGYRNRLEQSAAKTQIPTLDAYEETTRIQTSSAQERVLAIVSLYDDLDIKFAISITRGREAKEALSEEYKAAVVRAGRTLALRQIVSRAIAIVGFTDAQIVAFLERLLSPEIALRTAVRRIEEKDPTIPTNINISAQQIADFRKKYNGLLNLVQQGYLFEIMMLVYNTDIKSPQFAHRKPGYWSSSFSAMPETLPLSRNVWENDDPAFFKKAFQAVEDSVTRLRNRPGNIQEYRASGQTLRTSMREWFNKKRNPNTSSDDDSTEKKDLASSLNWLEEVNIAMMSSVVNSADKIITGQNWGENICCAVKMFAIMQKLVIPNIDIVSGVAGFAAAGYIAGPPIKDARGRRSVGAKEVAVAGAGVAGALLPRILGQDSEEITRLKEELQAGNLSPEEKAQKIEELERQVDSIGALVGWLKWIQKALKLAQIAKNKQDQHSFQISQIIGAYLMPLLKREIKKLDHGWNASTGARIAAASDTRSFREKLIAARNRNAALQKQSLTEVALDANEATGDDFVAPHNFEQIMVRCLPVVEIFDDIILPVIPNLLGFIEDFLYEVYKLLIVNVNKSEDSMRISSRIDLINWLDMLIRWMDQNAVTLAVNKNFCARIEPSKEDIESFLNSLPVEIALDAERGTNTPQELMRRKMNPEIFQKRIDELRGKETLNELTFDEEAELATLNAVSVFWAI